MIVCVYIYIYRSIKRAKKIARESERVRKEQIGRKGHLAFPSVLVSFLMQTKT